MGFIMPSFVLTFETELLSFAGALLYCELTVLKAMKLKCSKIILDVDIIAVEEDSSVIVEAVNVDIGVAIVTITVVIVAAVIIVKTSTTSSSFVISTYEIRKPDVPNFLLPSSSSSPSSRMQLI